jgi:hypothetical protein
MSNIERLLLAWIALVVMGVIFYLTHPKRSWIKKLQKKLAALKVSKTPTSSR